MTPNSILPEKKRGATVAAGKIWIRNLRNEAVSGTTSGPGNFALRQGQLLDVKWVCHRR